MFAVFDMETRSRASLKGVEPSGPSVTVVLSNEPSAAYVAELARDYDQMSLAMCDILTLACDLTTGDPVAIRKRIEEIALLALDGDYVSDEEN